MAGAEVDRFYDEVFGFFDDMSPTVFRKRYLPKIQDRLKQRPIPQMTKAQIARRCRDKGEVILDKKAFDMWKVHAAAHPDEAVELPCRPRMRKPTGGRRKEPSNSKLSKYQLFVKQVAQAKFAEGGMTKKEALDYARELWKKQRETYSPEQSAFTPRTWSRYTKPSTAKPRQPPRPKAPAGPTKPLKNNLSKREMFLRQGVRRYYKKYADDPADLLLPAKEVRWDYCMKWDVWPDERKAAWEPKEKHFNKYELESYRRGVKAAEKKAAEKAKKAAERKKTPKANKKGKPMKKLSKYNLYVKQHLPALRRANPELSHGEAMKAVGAQWRALQESGEVYSPVEEAFTPHTWSRYQFPDRSPLQVLTKPSIGGLLAPLSPVAVVPKKKKTSGSKKPKKSKGIYSPNFNPSLYTPETLFKMGYIADEIDAEYEDEAGALDYLDAMAAAADAEETAALLSTSPAVARSPVLSVSPEGNIMVLSDNEEDEDEDEWSPKALEAILAAADAAEAKEDKDALTPEQQVEMLATTLDDSALDALASAAVAEEAEEAVEAEAAAAILQGMGRKPKGTVTQDVLEAATILGGRRSRRHKKPAKYSPRW